MKFLRRSLWLNTFVAAGAAFAAAIFAAIAIRKPEIWPLLPKAPMELAVRLLGASNQEQVADGEFLGTWAVAFVVVMAVAYLSQVLLRQPEKK